MFTTLDRIQLATSAFLGLILAVPCAAFATVADDLCDALDDPCVVSGKVTVDPGSTLDFDTRSLVVGDGATLTWSDDLTIVAGACDFSAKSKVTEAKTSPGTGFLNLDCDSSSLGGSIKTVGAGIIVDGPGPHEVAGKIQAKGDQVGVIAIDSAGMPGDITVSGSIQAKSATGTPPGEFRLLTNFGDIEITGSAKIKIQGQSADPFSEFFYFETGSGSLTIDGKIDARAKSGAYALNFEADQAVLFGPKSQLKTKAVSQGPEIAINSQSASVTLQGKISAPTKDPGSGDGGLVHVCAADDITVDGGAKIDTSTGGSDGQIILGAGDAVQIGSSEKGAQLASKTDGLIEICGNTSGVTITSNSKITPDPEAVGSNECLSPSSQVIFFLDCNQ